MAGFVLPRVRAHRPLLAAAPLTVVLTTSVLATFTASTGAIGDAALRRTLQYQATGSATVNVRADEAGGDPGALDAAVRERLGDAFDGLPATVASTRPGPGRGGPGRGGCRPAGTHDPAVTNAVRRTVAIHDGRTASEVVRRTEVDEHGQESVVARST